MALTPLVFSEGVTALQMKERRAIQCMLYMLIWLISDKDKIFR